ncbi:hypothetical protein KC349_g2993 [Hortaea werneckii]|nr:hypothetical protein KC349_g2993 [Hortaea werneckii]
MVSSYYPTNASMLNRSHGGNDEGDRDTKEGIEDTMRGGHKMEDQEMGEEHKKEDQEMGEEHKKEEQEMGEEHKKEEQEMGEEHKKEEQEMGEEHKKEEQEMGEEHKKEEQEMGEEHKKEEQEMGQCNGALPRTESKLSPKMPGATVIPAQTSNEPLRLMSPPQRIDAHVRAHGLEPLPLPSTNGQCGFDALSAAIANARFPQAVDHETFQQVQTRVRQGLVDTMASADYADMVRESNIFSLAVDGGAHGDLMQTEYLSADQMGLLASLYYRLRVANRPFSLAVVQNRPNGVESRHWHCGEGDPRDDILVIRNVGDVHWEGFVQHRAARQGTNEVLRSRGVRVPSRQEKTSRAEQVPALPPTTTNMAVNSTTAAANGTGAATLNIPLELLATVVNEDTLARLPNSVQQQIVYLTMVRSEEVAVTFQSQDFPLVCLPDYVPTGPAVVAFHQMARQVFLGSNVFVADTIREMSDWLRSLPAAEQQVVRRIRVRLPTRTSKGLTTAGDAETFGNFIHDLRRTHPQIQVEVAVRSTPRGQSSWTLDPEGWMRSREG